MVLEDPFGNNRIEDVTWLCSLTESELDMLISLRKMVIQRAKVIGHTDLANKIDLKMLRALGFILMEYCKAQMRDQGLAGSDAFLDKCNLLDTSLNGDVDIQDLLACVTIDLRKRKVERHQTEDDTRAKRREHR
uniref:Uncharacterized protein n=2 Tax=Kalanchoe fedtschenkoi TaxID=63787 RepID=A0A7N0UDH0_KALFE